MAYCNSCRSYNCGCNHNHYQPCLDDTGCPIQLDAGCVIYGKNNNQVSGLVNLDLPNGSTLKLILDTIDANLEGFEVEDWSLPCLRDVYTINTLQQFAQSVDTQLCALQADIEDVADLAALPITPVDTTSIDLTVSGIGSHTIAASLIISATSGNRLSVVSDGALVVPQTLSADYDAKTISIAGGNTIDMLNFCGCEDCNSFLGELASDPLSPSAGQYWYNTSTSQLRIFIDSAKYNFTLTAV